MYVTRPIGLRQSHAVCHIVSASLAADWNISRNLPILEGAVHLQQKNSSLHLLLPHFSSNLNVYLHRLSKLPAC